MKLVRLAIVLLILLGAVSSVSAQEVQMTMMVTMPDGLTVLYPDNWATTFNDNDVLMLQSENTSLYMFLYPLWSLEEQDIEAGDAVSMLGAYYTENTQAGDEEYDPEAVTTITVNDREIVYFEPTFTRGNDTYTQIFGALTLDDTGRIVTFAAYSMEEAEVTEQDEVFAIVATAQTGTWMYGDGTAFTYPPEWDAYMDENGSVSLIGEKVEIRIDHYSPEAISELGASEDNLTPVLEDYFNGMVIDTTLTFDPASAFTFGNDEFNGVGYEYKDTYEGITYDRVFLLDLTLDGWGHILALVPPGEATELTDKEIGEGLAVLDSFVIPPTE